MNAVTHYHAWPVAHIYPHPVGGWVSFYWFYIGTFGRVPKGVPYEYRSWVPPSHEWMP